MAPTTGPGWPLPPPPPPPPLATRNGVGWIVIAFVILLGLLIWALIPKSIPPVNSSYNPTAICPTPAPKPVDRSINNPLGIKYFGDFIKKVAEDSGITAQDGGTFARFATPELGIDAGKQLLRSKTGVYAGKTVDWSLREKWSNGGYGAEIAPSINPDAMVNDLPDAQMDVLLAAMRKRENVGPVATAVLYVNPNDHSNETLREFMVEPPVGCFDYNIVTPPRSWRSWAKDVITEDPAIQVGIWFFGSGSSKGPFTIGTFPDYPYAPSRQWRLQRTGKMRVRYIQTR